MKCPEVQIHELGNAYSMEVLTEAGIGSFNLVVVEWARDPAVDDIVFLQMAPHDIDLPERRFLLPDSSAEALTAYRQRDWTALVPLLLTMYEDDLAEADRTEGRSRKGSRAPTGTPSGTLRRRRSGRVAWCGQQRLTSRRARRAPILARSSGLAPRVRCTAPETSSACVQAAPPRVERARMKHSKAVARPSGAGRAGSTGRVGTTRTQAIVFVATRVQVTSPQRRLPV